MVAKAMLIRLIVGTALVVTAVSSQAIARGGAHAEDPWAAAHIDGLPAEVRQVISRPAQACGAKLASPTRFHALHQRREHSTDCRALRTHELLQSWCALHWAGLFTRSVCLNRRRLSACSERPRV